MGNRYSSSPSSTYRPSSQSPSAEANQLSAEEFSEAYFTAITIPVSLTDTLNTTFHGSSTIPEHDLEACFELVRKTSVDGYKASSWGWSSRNKLREMRDEDMKFLLVHQNSVSTARADADQKKSNVVAFLSFMLTVEDDLEVVYCYEIHLDGALRGRGVGTGLMRIMEDIGRLAKMQKAMLTVFTSNEDARKFYEHIGYTLYDEEAPPPRKRLRSRNLEESRPTFVILSKDIDQDTIFA